MMTDPASPAGTVGTGKSTVRTAASVTAFTVGALGLGTLLYAHKVELNRFTLRHAEVVIPGLPRELKVLHISDLHYVPGQTKKYRWVQQLAELKPDLVVNTGDNLSDPRAVGEVLGAMGPLMKFPGCFVPGSNDYYAPRFKNPLKYFRGPSGLHPKAKTLPTDQLFEAFGSAGWANLTNAHTATELNGITVAFTGVDDPHLDLDEFTGWPDAAADLKIGVAHAPFRRVLETFADAGADIAFAGHTHGGQICLPSFSKDGGRALVTNCDLPTRHAKGLHTIRRADGNDTHIHVSAGLGTSAKAPARLFCPPEATLITLVGD